MSNKINHGDKIALLLRGHIRNTFDNDSLYNFVKSLSSMYDIDIYISTFNIKNGGKIFMDGFIDNNIIDTNMIINYFRDIASLIKNINISTNGIAEKNNDKFIGNISKNKLLHMWTSINDVITSAKNTNINYEYAINMRIDYFGLVKGFYDTKCTNYMKKLFHINIFDNFINHINKNDPITFSNVDCDSVMKNISIFGGKINNNSKTSHVGASIAYFANKRKEKIKKICLTNVKYNDNDILYGIDNIFGGKIDYLYEISCVFVSDMNSIFDFLEKIFPEMGILVKPHGPPHEAIFPLFIKNFL